MRLSIRQRRTMNGDQQSRSTTVNSHADRFQACSDLAPRVSSAAVQLFSTVRHESLNHPTLLAAGRLVGVNPAGGDFCSVRPLNSAETGDQPAAGRMSWLHGTPWRTSRVGVLSGLGDGLAGPLLFASTRG
jgi:hypothetical protein